MARAPRRRATVVPAHFRVTVTCPLCAHRVPFDAFSQELAHKRALAPEFWRLWPRKPDGSRGFHWERLSDEQLHPVEAQSLDEGRFDRLWQEAVVKVSKRMVEWLNRFGLDPQGRRVCVKLSVLEE